MALMRNLLLAGSTSPWLREQAMRRRFVRRAVARFMPGERLEDALAAAAALEREGLTTILTALGENLTRPQEAEEVAAHYLTALDEVSRAGLHAHISVKPTQLGLDLDPDMCQRHLSRLVERAEARDNLVWIDMESSPYVDRTLALFRRTRERTSRIGVALQAYLYRTAQDVERLLPLGPAIRIVKGAYLEPASAAYPNKRDVDENFYRLVCRLLSPESYRSGSLVHIATHDVHLIDRLTRYIGENGVPASAYEFAMLYGIQRSEQERLAREGRRLRVLISYGAHWFPWYMRRLAERPANVLFAVRQLVG
jgi:proline dehydrogenase